MSEKFRTLRDMASRSDINAVWTNMLASGALGAFAADYCFTGKPPNGPAARIY